MSDAPTHETTITVPTVSGAEVAAATDRIEQLAARYGIAAADLDVLFNAFVAVYVRDRIVYAEGKAPPCACAPTGDCGEGSPCGGSGGSGPCC